MMMMMVTVVVVVVVNPLTPGMAYLDYRLESLWWESYRQTECMIERHLLSISEICDYFVAIT